jgi:hypothetical protein
MCRQNEAFAPSPRPKHASTETYLDELVEELVDVDVAVALLTKRTGEDTRVAGRSAFPLGIVIPIVVIHT